MEDVQDLLLDVLRRLEVTSKELAEARAANPLLSDEDLKKALRNESAIWDPASIISQLACSTGCNFRLLAWVLSLLGGATTTDALSDWEKGDDSLAQLPSRRVLSSCLVQACLRKCRMLCSVSCLVCP